MLSSNTHSSLMNRSEIEDEIDLRQVASSLSRHRRLIASISGVSLLLSAFYAFTRSPVWEGQFQIVLEQNQSISATDRLAGNSALAMLAGLGGSGGSELQTEVKILESPSVLKTTYEFVKSEKKKNGDDTSNFTFKDWRNANLSIELEKNTSVLNISYRDTNINLILPVLERISNDYKLYSARDRSESIQNGLRFADEQVKKFRKKAETSSRALDAFSIKYGISGRPKSIGGAGIDVLNLISSASENPILLDQPVSASSVNTKGDAFGKLASVNLELLRRQQRYTNKDYGVRALVRERDALRRYIELTAGGYLTLPGQQPASKEEAQELILKYVELDRKATRDIETLNTLESSLLSLQLEQARQTDHWELISTPTLLEQPVAPKKLQLLVLGLLVGVVGGSSAAMLVERRTGLVFSADELKALLPCPLLKEVPAQNPSAWQDAADLLSNGPLATANSSPVALVPVGSVPADQLQAFAEELRRALGRRKLLVSSDLRKTSSCATQLLLIAPGVATRTQLSQLNQKLALQGSPLAGWVLLDPKLELS